MEEELKKIGKLKEIHHKEMKQLMNQRITSERAARNRERERTTLDRETMSR